MLKFDPHRSAMERSFSLRAFNQYETEINKHFWSFKVVSDYSGYIARNERRKNPEYRTSKAFHASGPDAERIPPTVTEWLEAREELENWLRMSALVSAASYYEAYLRQIARSALMASPLLRIGSPRLLEGTVLLKAGKEIPFTQELEMITKGDWNTRAANFVKLFGKPHSGSPFPITDLERIRKIRNDFAHGFGRALEPPGPSIGRIEPARRLGQKKLIEYVAALSISASKIDRYLLPAFIGNFELIHCYHLWKKAPAIGKDASFDEPRRFQRHLNGTIGFTINRQFCRDLIAFYNAA